MFHFIEKQILWEALDANWIQELESHKISYQLKIAQDLAVYRELRDLSDKSIAEVGGGDSRILPALSKKNACFNIDRCEGRGHGPTSRPEIAGVTTIDSYLGEGSSNIESNRFDILFSISVVEHIDDNDLDAFLSESIRVLKPGGKFYHAIDFYLHDAPTPENQHRIDRYFRFLTETPGIQSLSEVNPISPAFKTRYVSNPDNILHGWNLYAPQLSELRQVSQSVSLFIAGEKIP